MSNNFAPVQTDIGFAEMVKSKNDGQDWRISHIAIGDANGESYVPTPAQTSLKNEKMRVAISDSDVMAEGFKVKAEFAFDPEIGAFETREIGFYMTVGDNDPVLWACYSTPGQIINLMNEYQNLFVGAFNVIITRGDASNLLFVPNHDFKHDINLKMFASMALGNIKNSAAHIKHIISNKYKGA